MNTPNYIPTELGPVGIYAEAQGIPYEDTHGAEVIGWFRRASHREQIDFVHRLHDTERKHWNQVDRQLAMRLARILGDTMHRLADRMLNGE